MLDDFVEPVVAGPDVEMVARIVVHLGPPPLRDLDYRLRGHEAVEVGNLNQQRAPQFPAALDDRTIANWRPTPASISLRHVGPAMDR